jgi:hypothetical protein
VDPDQPDKMGSEYIKGMKKLLRSEKGRMLLFEH